jgi:hypothetical protein
MIRSILRALFSGLESLELVTNIGAYLSERRGVSPQSINQALTIDEPARPLGVASAVFVVQSGKRTGAWRRYCKAQMQSILTHDWEGVITRDCSGLESRATLRMTRIQKD